MVRPIRIWKKSVQPSNKLKEMQIKLSRILFSVYQIGKKLVKRNIIILCLTQATINYALFYIPILSSFMKGNLVKCTKSLSLALGPKDSTF